MSVSLLQILAQIVTILVTARVLGLAFRRAGQPQVIGEMVAGIALGPSLLGALWPQGFNLLFRPEALGFLNALSQLGAILFMFVVGLELDLDLLRKRAGQAAAAAAGSIVVPLLMGYLLGLMLWQPLGEPAVTRQQFAFFFAAALSVTAFPVLARILAEQRLVSTQFGATALACAAVNDLAAWCLLAFVVLLVGRNDATLSLPWMLGLVAVFIAVVFGLVRPLVPRLARIFKSALAKQDLLALVLALMLGGAWATERIGLHAIFGAFVVGVAMPKDHHDWHELRHKLEDFTVVLLLPLFFAYTGLRTSIGLLGSANALGFAVVITAVAVIGKLGGTAIAARLAGMERQEAVALGVLMNTRGLMELVLLNIGLEIGVISPAVYTMLVVMTVVTTGMTSPLLQRFPRERLLGQPIPARPLERPASTL